MREIELNVSAARRVFAVGVLLMLGGLLLMLSFQADMQLWARAVLIGLGAGALVMSMQLHKATQSGLRLTQEGLLDSEGTLIAAMGDIASVDRGTFAFKPSNGFILRLKRPAPRHWAPGLWWRVGRRVGVGGVTAAAPAKAMAEEISLRLSGAFDGWEDRDV